MAAAFEAFGLGGYKARVLCSLLELGAATPAELHGAANLPRTSVYPVLRELAGDGLVARVTHERGGRWVAPDPDVIVARLGGHAEERLMKAQSERLREFEAAQQALETLRERMDEARLLIDEVVTREPRAPFGFIHLIRDEWAHVDLYARLLSTVETEVLVFNKGPYHSFEVNDAVLAMLERGVPTRALYQAHELVGPETQAFRDLSAIYQRAGAESRVVDELPYPLAVFDRHHVLLALDDPMLDLATTPTPAHISHVGFGRAQGELFDSHWDRAHPVDLSSSSTAH